MFTFNDTTPKRGLRRGHPIHRPGQPVLQRRVARAGDGSSDVPDCCPLLDEWGSIATWSAGSGKTHRPASRPAMLSQTTRRSCRTISGPTWRQGVPNLEIRVISKRIDLVSELKYFVSKLGNSQDLVGCILLVHSSLLFISLSYFLKG